MQTFKLQKITGASTYTTTYTVLTSGQVYIKDGRGTPLTWPKDSARKHYRQLQEKGWTPVK